MTKGIFYAIGTGPGNPEMLTAQAARIIKSCESIFFPATGRNTIALDSLAGMDLSGKNLIPCRLSMTRDEKKSSAEYEAFVKECAGFLEKGGSVAFLSVGDVSLYSSASRAAAMIKKSGFEVRFVPGVTSFSAAACSALLPLCGKDDKLSVIPADAFFEGDKLRAALEDEGTKILMKAGRHLEETVLLLSSLGLIQGATLVRRAGTESERIFRGEEIMRLPDEAFEDQYLSVLIVRN